jgi:mono/diheme cytochrome c family protein
MKVRTVALISIPLSIAAGLVLGLVATGAAYAADAPTKAAAPASDPARVARGKYLVDTGGCGDCHTPLKIGANGPEPDMTRLLSGHPASLRMPPAPKLPAGPWGVVVSATNTAWAGPWGVTFTANLTPDASGLGGWTAKQFADTMRTGKHLGVGREILPPMPIPAYRNFNDADLEAIFAYLQSIPAVKNKVPAPLPPAAPPPLAKK